MRILVTGITGFLGQHIGAALTARGDLVVGLMRDTRQVFYTPPVVVHGSFDQVERTIAEYECDAVIHLAAQVQVSTAAADPTGTLETNIQGTWQVLEACRRQRVQRVLVASSDKSYGDGEVPYREAQPLVPHGVYATSKACGDLLAQAYEREFGMPIAITRCSNLYGPGHTNWTTLIPGTIRSLLRGERPQLRSNGGPRRDFLFVEDAVDGYLRLLGCEESGPFNFGTGRASTVREVVDCIARLMGKEPAAAFDVSARGLGAGGLEIRDQVVETTKAERMLGWRPEHSLETGLAKTIEWYERHRETLG